MYELEILPCIFCCRPVLRKKLFQRTQNQSERRAEFVAHVGKEFCFGSVNLRQGFSASTLLLISAGIRNDHSYSVGKLFAKAAIVFINRQSWTCSNDDDSNRRFSTSRNNRPCQRRFWRFRIRSAR